LEEEWREIDGYSNYIVSSYGRIYSKKSDKFIKPFYGKSSKGINKYKRVRLYANGKAKNKFVHKLVVEHFVENPDPEIKLFVNHIDCNKSNNHKDNLEWVTA